MTLPHTTSTITLTNGSPIITGTGTDWQTAGIVGGMVFPLATGNVLPIASVQNNLQMTAAVPWIGPSGNYQYALVRDTAWLEQVTENAELLTTVIKELRYPSIAALSSLVPAANKLPYFNGQQTAALADFPDAALLLLAGGVVPNGQLPQRLRASTHDQVLDANNLGESGLYFLLNGSANVPGGSGNWYIDHKSQSGVVAGKQIAYAADNFQVWERFIWYGAYQPWKRRDIERGSNANGDYTRFPDGMQICVSPMFSNIDVNQPNGALFLSANVDWTYPAAFSAPPTGGACSTSPWVWAAPSFAGTTSASAKLHFAFSVTAQQLQMFAIGRWF